MLHPVVVRPGRDPMSATDLADSRPGGDRLQNADEGGPAKRRFRIARPSSTW